MLRQLYDALHQSHGMIK